MDILVKTKGYLLKRMLLCFLFSSYFFNFTNVHARMMENSPFFYGKIGCYDLFTGSVYYPYYEKEYIGEYVAYSKDFPASDETYQISSNILHINRKSSEAFWKSIFLFASHVMSIYNDRKVHADKDFLTEWGLDVKKGKYDASFVRVFSANRGDDLLGTLRFVRSDPSHKLPLEKFLGIRLDSSDEYKYELGLLTVDKGLSIEERNRVRLEIWVNLVALFKEANREKIKVYVFADTLGSQIYTRWGFSRVKSYYKDGKKIYDTSVKKYQKGLQWDDRVQQWVLEYELSQNNLKELLYHISGGKYTLDSEVVIDRLKSLDLYGTFEEGLETQIRANVSEYMYYLHSVRSLGAP